MTTAELSRSDLAAPLVQPVGRERSFSISLEVIAYAVLAILSAILHYWSLGDRALHHDETLHASYAWYIYQGRGFMHDPLLHGPFLYYVGALMYFLFGDNDFTARLGAATFGAVLPLLPFLIRRELGRPVALIAATYMLISPVILYVGRFVRHDVYSLVFEMLVFISIVRYATSHQARWLIIGAAAFGFMLTNQETAYLFLLIMGTPLVLLFLWHTYRPAILIIGALGVMIATLMFILPGKPEVDGEHNITGAGKAGPIFGWGPLATADNGYALRIRNHADGDGGLGLLQNLGNYLRDLGEFFGHPAVITSIFLVLLIGGALWWLIWRQRDSQGKTRWQHALDSGNPIMSGFASLRANHRLWIAFGFFFSIYALFFTSFLTNWLGIITGTTGSLLYWLAQHNVQRGSQPNHYYAVMMVIYEILPLIFGIIGFILLGRYGWDWFMRSRKGEIKAQEPNAPLNPEDMSQPRNWLLPLFLGWWALAAFAIYSWAGEKMPWLTIHIAVPWALFAAWSFWRVTRALSLRDLLTRPIAIVMTIFLVIAGTFYTNAAQFANLVDSNDSSLQEYAGLSIIMLTIVFLVVLFVIAGNVVGWRRTVAVFALSIGLLGSVYTIRNTYRVTYVNGDVPNEMLIYTQTSPDVMRMVRYVETISNSRDKKPTASNSLTMPIMWDNETVWQWYFRNFKNGDSGAQSLTTAPNPDVQAVFVLGENFDRSEEARTNYLSALKDFRIQKFPLRWWFPEDEVYRLGDGWSEKPVDDISLVGRVLRAPTANKTLAEVWDLLMYRQLPGPLGSADFYVAVRPEIAGQMGPGFGADK